MKIKYLSAVSMLVAAPLHADWSITAVDTGTYNGWFPSMVLDSTGQPRVAYLHFGGGSSTSLKYAQRNDGVWTTETVESGAQTGWEPSLALTSTGSPRIAYHSVSGVDLKYASWNGVSWDVAILDDEANGSTHVGIGPSLALDPTAGNLDAPAITYYVAQPNYDLYLYRKTGFSSTAAPVSALQSTPDDGRYSSLLLDPNTGHFRIAYFESGTYDVKLVSTDGMTLTYETIDSVGEVGECVKLRRDANGTLKVCYYDRTNGALKYARRTTSGWVVETVDDADNVGEGCSLVLDSFGNPRISYYDRTNGNLKMAAFDGTAWHVEVVDATGDVGSWTSIACDSTGKTMIAYTDFTTGELKFAESVPGTTFSVGVAVAPAGQGTTGGAGFYEGGSSATIQAFPIAGYVFSGWTGSVTGPQNPLTLTVDAHKSITANFVRDLADPDGDGLTNYDESVTHGTNPNLADTDGDSIGDGDEVAAGSRAKVSDAGLIAWLQANPQKIGLHNETTIQDLNLGGVMLKATGSDVEFTLQLQESGDLSQPWMNAGTATFTRPMLPGKGFLRVRALGPQP